jgi:hypothetical protein
MRDSAAKPPSLASCPARTGAQGKDAADLVTRTPEPDQEGHTEQADLPTLTPVADEVPSRA